MSITHEQLKKNVEVSRERLDTSRERRALWVKRHGTQRKIAIGAIALWAFNVFTMFVFHPVWVGLIFLLCMAGAFGVSLEGMTNARKGIKRAQEDANVQLSDVVDDIQALVDRETLALMNPERYAELERPTEPVVKKFDRPTSTLMREEEYRRKRAQASISLNMLTNNERVSYTRVMPDGTVRKETINLDTGEVSITW